MKKLQLFRILLIALLFVILCYLGCKVIANNEIKGWEKYKSRNTSLYIPDNKSTFKILPKALCWSNRLLVIFVISSGSNYRYRKSIRNTWAKNVDNATVYFVIGSSTNENVEEQLFRESNQYDDIIQENFIESPSNETLQSIAMLKVVQYFCGANTEFLFQTHDDSYVNVHLLEEYLLENKRSDLLLEKLLQNVKPIRKSSDKRYSPDYLYQDEVYPNFLAGKAGYLMSSKVAMKLYKAALKTPVFPIADIYITGICAKEVNIAPTNDYKFVNEELCYEPCLMNQIFAIPHLSMPELIHLHNDFHELHRNYTKCSDQYKERWIYSFVYESIEERNSFLNWLLGHCCFRGQKLILYEQIFWFGCLLLIILIVIVIYLWWENRRKKYKKLG